MDSIEKYSLTLGEEELLVLETVDLAALEHWKIPSTLEELGTLTSLVGLAARGAASVGQTVINGNTVKLVLTPELRRAMREGADFSKKGGVFGSQVFKKTEEGQRIIGNARFKPADAARVANIAGAAWQIAAVVTAQHYMAEIDTRLKNVSDGVRGLAEFLNNKQNAELAAAQDALRRDLRVYLDDPTSEEDRRILTGTLHRVFELAQENAGLRVKNIRTVTGKMQQDKSDNALRESEPEAQAFLFALSVGAEALVASILARQSEGRFRAFEESFTQILGSFGEAMQALRVEYQTRLQDNQPAHWADQALWQKPLPHNLVRHFKNRHQDRQHQRWKEAHEQVSATSSALMAQIGTVSDSIHHLAQYRALPQQDEGNVALLVTLNGQGDVEEVYVPVEARSS